MIMLEDKTDMLTPENAEHMLRQMQKACLQNAHVPGCRREHASHNIQQRGFSGAGGALRHTHSPPLIVTLTLDNT